MNLHQLRVFFYVSHCLSFSRASDELHISQPAVSVQVRKLEEEIGVELIEQIGKKLHLTEPGQLLQAYADRIFAAEREAENMLNDFRGLNTGSLVVGVSSVLGTYYVPPMLAEFRQQYPKLDVVMKMGNSEWVEEQILKNSIDMALVSGDLLHATELHVMPFLHDELVIIAAPDHPLAGKPIQMTDLYGQPFILREPGSDTRRVFRDTMMERNIPVHVLMELESMEAIKRLVSSGLGLSVVSKLALEWEISCGRLIVLQVQNLSIDRHFSIAWHKDKKPTRAMQAFTDFLCHYASDHYDFLQDCECARRNNQTM